jgi:hypothetical protein
LGDFEQKQESKSEAAHFKGACGFARAAKSHETRGVVWLGAVYFYFERSIGLFAASPYTNRLSFL